MPGDCVGIEGRFHLDKCRLPLPPCSTTTSLFLFSSSSSSQGLSLDLYFCSRILRSDWKVPLLDCAPRGSASGHTTVFIIHENFSRSMDSTTESTLSISCYLIGIFLWAVVSLGLTYLAFFRENF